MPTFSLVDASGVDIPIAARGKARVAAFREWFLPIVEAECARHNVSVPAFIDTVPAQNKMRHRKYDAEGSRAYGKYGDPLYEYVAYSDRASSSGRAWYGTSSLDPEKFAKMPLRWRRRYSARLRVVVGSDVDDYKLVGLHELAHHLTPHGSHGPEFWAKAAELFRRHGTTAEKAWTREQGYRGGGKTLAQFIVCDVAKKTHEWVDGEFVLA